MIPIVALHSGKHVGIRPERRAMRAANKMLNVDKTHLVVRPDSRQCANTTSRGFYYIKLGLVCADPVFDGNAEQWAAISGSPMPVHSSINRMLSSRALGHKSRHPNARRRLVFAAYLREMNFAVSRSPAV